MILERTAPIQSMIASYSIFTNLKRLASLVEDVKEIKVSRTQGIAWSYSCRNVSVQPPELKCNDKPGYFGVFKIQYIPPSRQWVPVSELPRGTY